MHARFFHDDTGVFLEDLGSANGSFLDDQKVEGIVPLETGQIIRFGQSHSSDPTVLQIDLAPNSPDVGKTRPVAALEDPTVTPRPIAHPRIHRPPSDDTTVDDLTLPGTLVSEIQASARASPLNTRPLPIVGEQPPKSLHPGLWIGLGACLAVLLMLLVRGCSSDDPWSKTRITPELLEPGQPFELSRMSPGFEHGFDLEIEGVLVGDLEISGIVGQGVVPALNALEPGDHEVQIVGYADDRVVFERQATLRRSPRIERLSSLQGHLGERVSIIGTALTSSNSRSKLFLGSIEVPIESASEELIEFRIPKLAGAPPFDLPLRILTGGLETEYPSPLRVLSNQFYPIPIEIAAQIESEPDLWKITTTVGPMLYLHANQVEVVDETPSAQPLPKSAGLLAGASRPLPARIEEVTQNLRHLFKRAQTKTVEVRAVPANDGFSFQPAETSTPDEEPLFFLSFEELNLLTSVQESTASPRLRANWLATTLTSVAAVISAGRSPQSLPHSDYSRALQHLIESNLERGGSGRPDPNDLAQLAPVDHEALQLAFVTVPSSFDSLTGRWIGRLDNTFDPTSDEQLEITVDMRQELDQLSGSARAVFRSRAGSQGLPVTEIHGTVTDSIPPTLRLDMRFNRPLGDITLEGQLNSAGVAGTFRSSMAASGTWKASRY